MQIGSQQIKQFLDQQIIDNYKNKQQSADGAGVI